MLSLPVLVLYTDGGPDHRLTYLSVQLALIGLFQRLKLDALRAACTASCHSQKNPVERVMSIFNLGLQSLGLIREKQSEDFEKATDKCKNMSNLHAVADKCPEFKATVLDSIAPVKMLLTKLFERLQLKEESFKPITAASEDVDVIWNLIQEVEPSLVRGESLRKEHIH